MKKTSQPLHVSIRSNYFKKYNSSFAKLSAKSRMGEKENAPLSNEKVGGKNQELHDL